MFTPTIGVKRDSYVNQDAPAQNYGAAAALKLNGQSSHKRYVFLYFAPPAHFAGDLVVSATFRIHLKGAWAGGAHTVTAKRVTQTWTESGLKYNNMPSVSATHSASAAVTGGADGDELEFDVTDMLQDVASGSAFYGIRLELDTTGTKSLYSSESTSPGFRPRLELEYTAAPDAATNLYPDGLDLFTDLPLLRWEFMDVTPGETQAYSWVQVTTTDDPDFLSPEFDDGGFIANTLHQYDLSDTAYAGVPDEESRLWRVKVKDGNGGESDWSDSAEFAYYSAGSLTIDSPAADGDDVEDSTPTIAWTFSGRTQESFSVHLQHYVSGVYQDVYVHFFEVSTDTDWNPPEGFITEVGGRYRFLLYVNDTLRRPNVPVASRVFDFVPTGMVTAPSSLAAVGSGGGIDLEWQRASTPDHFGILVDGELVQVVDGADALVSGTAYAYTLYGTTPGVEHAITVRAKTDGTGWSNDSNSVDVIHTPIGIWLVETTLPLPVRLADRNSNPGALSQDGETFQLLNRRDPVRVSGVARGYSGTVSGKLISDDTSTAAEKLADMETIMGLYALAGNLRLVFGAAQYPVIVANFTQSKGPSSDEYDVTFDWWQVGDFTVPVSSGAA